ncbi:transglycosylase domain-containing protein [Streptomyces tirandamycinicus]|uniref:transglycosylase domain-containing protein n=1 Tax=Streptomyces tirandamycinicus TaxID=2174846 RepID=UPI00226D9F07|nr:transglycosylase domain-containing protein [Streptomyces tirandamycinicus]MCY0982890.1 transglycosylase domain-containing protein [Streptomyces tirandamycinicus]
MGRAEARRARQRDARRVGKAGGIRRFLTWRRLLGTFFTACLLGMGALFIVYLLVPVPAANAQAEKESNVYKYADGSLLTRTGTVNREIVGLDKIPDEVEKAFVAAENKTFYKDSGVDLKGTARGVFNTLTGGGKQGGSTITQQYVKNYYLNQDQTVTRKLKELVISLKVDQQKDKEEILAGYLNTSYYGRGAYGIQAAAQAYYRKDAQKLTVAEGAYLAALLQAPSQYDWAVASPTGRKLVSERWNYVLDNMVEQNWLDASARSGLEFPVPKEPKAAPGMEGQAGYLVKAANAELAKRGVSEDQIEAGGWTITLSIEKKRQDALVKAVDEQLEKKLDRDGDERDATVQAGATSVDPESGKVVALYGGVGATEHWISNATRRDYQPASTFKPVVLATALETRAETQDGRRIGLDTIYDGTSKRPVEGSDTPFAPENEDDRSYGPVTVQKATDSSINSVYAQMIVDVGPGKVKETALGLGMQDGEGWPVRPAMSLGTMGASTWDMAAVYATLDNHGEKVTPSIVKDAKHRTREAGPAPEGGDRVISREAADTVTKAMTGVVRSGSGRNAQGDYYAAGKTGTSENNRSAWFVGYTPELVTAVALFGEDTKGGQVTLTDTVNEGRANGGGVPALIWQRYTTGALGGGSGKRFDLELLAPVREEPPASPSGTPSGSEEPEEPSDEPSRPEEPEDPPSDSPDPTPSDDRPTRPGDSAGTTEGGGTDAGTTEGGGTDAGTTEGGESDGGAGSAGTTDGTTAGTTAGVRPRPKAS